MSEYVITKSSTKEERLAVIKAAAEKYNRSKAIRARLAEGAKRVRRYVDEEEKAMTKKFDAEISRLDENHNHYTDGAKYLAEHYGDRAADQKSYDADWN